MSNPPPPVALITGAGRGIGRATALELARLGYRLALCGRNRPPLEQTAGLAGVASLVETVDVTDPAAIERFVQHTAAHFGRLDALVNNAGVAPVLSVEQTTIDDWRRVIDTNLSAAFYASRAAWPVMRRQGGGAIVNLSSLAARDPFPGFAAYSAAKAGIHLLSLSLAREGKPHHIRVYTVAPGAVETEMFRALFTAQQVGTDKTMDPAEVARVIAQCIAGDLRPASGEVLYLSRT